MTCPARPTPAVSGARHWPGGAPSGPAGHSCDQARQATLAVLALSLRAIEGRVERQDIAAAAELVQRTFPPAHQLRQALTCFEACLRDPQGGEAAMRAAGKELGRAVSRATWPDQGERADVWG